MGPKRAVDKEKEPDVDDEHTRGKEMEDELRELKHQLMIADQQMAEQRMQSDSSCDRLTELLRKQDEQHEQRHSEMIRIYQERMADMCSEKDKAISDMQERERQSRDVQHESWRMNRRVRYEDQEGLPARQVTTSSYVNVPVHSSPVHRSAHSFEPMRQQSEVPVPADLTSMSAIPAVDARDHQRHYDIPLPRQLIFDGKMSWDSFIKPFQSTALACRWTEHDKLFRLTSSLRGDAAEYVFNQLSPETTQVYETLRRALESRFKERRTSASYLNELELRKFTQREKLLEYAADIKRLVIKGYPTADETTRETISVRSFLKGMSDQQLAVAVGMKDPQTIDDAREMVETYNSLRDDVSRGQKVRMVKFDVPTTNNPGTEARPANYPPKEEKNCVTLAEVEKLLSEKFRQMEAKIPPAAKPPSQMGFQGNNGNRPMGFQGNNGNQPKGAFLKTNVECYRCHKFGHYANECHPENRAGNQMGN